MIIYPKDFREKFLNIFRRQEHQTRDLVEISVENIFFEVLPGIFVWSNEAKRKVT